MKNKNVLISGAGVAGLTLAFWLKRYGYNPTIVEKYPILRKEGYKLDIRGKAVNVIKRMGLLQAVSEAKTDIRKAQFVDESGKVVQEVSAELSGIRLGEDLEIVRGDLCQILFNSLGDVNCLFGDSIKTLKQNEKSVYVTFEKNQPASFDLVIGADGLHSKVRKLAFGEETNFLKELGLYASYYSIPNYLHLDRVEIEYHTPKRFAIVYCPRDGMAKAGFAFSSSKPNLDLTKLKNQKEFLKKVYEGTGWEIPRLLSYVNETSDFYFDCIGQIHMDHWTKGRVALVGDAGYAVSPVSGQGTSVAIVGAYVLAGELAEAKGDFTKAFQNYENQLREFIEKNRKLAETSVAIMNGEGSSWIKTKMINIMFLLSKLMPGSIIEFFKRQSLKQTAKAANSINIKNYSAFYFE